MFYFFENISSFIFFSYVYRFVCDLQSLPEVLHAKRDHHPSVKKEDETTDAEDARINERDRFLCVLHSLIRSTTMVDLQPSIKKEDENTNGEDHEKTFNEV